MTARKVRTLADVTPDPANANRHTQRGRGLVERSMRQAGAGRSIVVDKHGTIIAGNCAAETWGDVADTDAVRVVETDGRELVVVQRTDLDLSNDADGRARFLALADNRASEVGLDWDPGVLAAQLASECMSLEDVGAMFGPVELDMIGAGDAAGAWRTAPGDPDGDADGDGLELVKLRLPAELAHRLRLVVGSHAATAADVVAAGLAVVTPGADGDEVDA